jgi:hypothetical protein
MKICNRCHIERPEGEFYQRKDGMINRICKVCKWAVHKLHYEAHKKEKATYYEAHKLEKKAYNEAYYEAHRVEIRTLQAVCYKVHKEERAVYCKEHKAEIAEQRRHYRQTPKGQAGEDRRHTHRRAIEHDAFIEDVDRQVVFERDGWRCQICRKKVNPTLKHPHPMSASLDHIVPLARGGTHEPKNVQLAHLGCNLSKNIRAVGCQLRVFG